MVFISLTQIMALHVISLSIRWLQWTTECDCFGVLANKKTRKQNDNNVWCSYCLIQSCMSFLATRRRLLAAVAV